MHLQLATITALAALSSALPTLKVRQSGPVLASTTYDAISISGGQAGNAEAEALAVFSALDVNNPGNIDPADIDFLGQVNDVANDAETGVFNPAIEAATGDEADALSAGKIKNKVLKLMATKIELEAKQAQGEDVAAKLEDETKKLNNNIATDKESAGKPSTALPFDASITGGGSTAAGAGAGAGAGNNDATAGNNNANQDDAAADDDDDDAAADDNANDNADDKAANNNQNQNQNNNAGGNASNNAGGNANNNAGGNANNAGGNANNNAGGDGGGATGNFLFGGN
ncbi:uncharacterized protein EKO05_0009051 [Ascochyta rabiei]|uniref:Uncharacterized protein n=1 Tax=Didymella rabiei TaxID=5454 RepID=A0A162X8H3_DIDRA|nr:uncharacterized protein EKO05_0009051 [Ascochyta rabiei]KZM19401.1 hypothetical protein ST47_g9442 [Ascochyta rabiei]UPX18760.1 hypothetical protein EKO05_0009051 [Ascochyta rabiei]